jgi:hypothetical protein
MTPQTADNAVRRKPLWRREPWLLLVSIGVGLVAVSVYLGMRTYGPGVSLSGENDGCSLLSGQVTGVVPGAFRAFCSSIMVREQWRGWLMVAGITALVAATAWGFCSRFLRDLLK